MQRIPYCGLWRKMHGQQLSGSRFDTVCATAQKWVDSALRSDGSVFAPGKAIWTSETLQELRLHFLD